jgi:CHASE3 domain sensor protein
VAGDHTAHQSFHAHSAHRLREVAQAEPEQLRTLNRMAMMIKRKLQTAERVKQMKILLGPGFINDPT